MKLFRLLELPNGELRFEPFNKALWLEAQVKAYEDEHAQRNVRENEFFVWWLLQPDDIKERAGN